VKSNNALLGWRFFLVEVGLVDDGGGDGAK
jgi:hypothetical protein